MDTQQLTYYLTLCEEMNYTAAAQRCFITRQAMRQAVQALEAAYGVALIENRHNRLSLTPAGRLLREKAQLVVALCAAMDKAMHACRAPQSPLRVGMSRSLLPFYAPELAATLDRLPAAYPGVTISTTLGTADELLAALSSGALDAVIAVDAGSLPLPLTRTELMAHPLRILLSAKHPLAGRRGLRLTDLDGLTVQLMSDPRVCFKQLDDALTAAGVQANYRIVPEFYDVGCNIRDNRCVSIDRADDEDAPATQIGQDRLLPLEGDAFSLCCCLYAPRQEAPAVGLLRQALLAART